MANGWALIGTGAFARTRIAPALNRALGCRLIAVVSRDRPRAEAFAEEHGAARAYDDLEAALRDPEVDHVWVATPHSLHLEPVLAAARAGKNVLCEKPLATSRVDAREMQHACRRAGVQLGTGFHLRHHPLHLELRRIQESGELGDILAAEAEWSTLPRRAGEGYSAAWRTDPAMAYAGITTGTGIHAIDLLRFVLNDDVVGVMAMTDSQTSPIASLETRALALLRFSRGALATVRCARGVLRPANDLVLISATARLATRHSLDEVARGTIEADGAEPQVLGVPVGTDLYALEAESFVDACARGVEPNASGEDGLRMVEVLEALLESAAKGRSVEL